MKQIKLGAFFIAGIMVFGICSSALAYEGHDDSKASGAVATITEEDIEYGPEEQTVRMRTKIPLNINRV